MVEELVADGDNVYMFEVKLHCLLFVFERERERERERKNIRKGVACNLLKDDGLSRISANLLWTKKRFLVII